MGKISDILKEEKFKELGMEVAKKLNLGEDVVVFTFPDIYVGDPIQILVRNASVRRGLLGAHAGRFKFVFINPITLESPDAQRVERELYKELGLEPRPQQLARVYLEKGYEVVLVVEGLEKSKNPGAFLQACQRIKRAYVNRVHFVYQLNAVPSKLIELEADPSTKHFFESGLVIFDPVGREGEPFFYNWCTRLFSHLPKMEGKDRQTLFSQSGGHFGLYKTLYQQKVSGDDSERVRRYTRAVLLSLTAFEVKVLKKISVAGILTESEKQVERIYLRGHLLNMLLDKDSLFLPALKSIECYNELRIDAARNLIVKNGIERLSNSERKILRALAKSEGLITKDELATVIWGETALEKFSLWALDQRICRLRAKLKGLGYNPRIIKTVSRKGYILGV